MRIALLAFAFLAFPACGTRRERVAQARPLAVRVVDAADGKPIAGVRVAYAVEATVTLSPLPLGGPDGRRVVYGVAEPTDERGEVAFSGEFKTALGRDRPDSQIVAVNLEVALDNPVGSEATRATAARCRDLHWSCADAPPELDALVYLLSRGVQAGSDGLVRPNPRYGGIAQVWAVDGPGSVRDPLTGMLRVEPLPARLGDPAAPFVVKLRRVRRR